MNQSINRHFISIKMKLEIAIDYWKKRRILQHSIWNKSLKRGQESIFLPIKNSACKMSSKN